jgi:uncharacterized protein
VLTEDYPIHQLLMRQYRVTPESAVKQAWLAANDDFRRYVLDLLADSGPLPGEAIEDRPVVGWVSTGWTHGRNVDLMLDILWKQGHIMVAGRDGLRRLWGPADLPAVEELPQAEIVTRARPVRVEGGAEQWWAHRDALGRLDEEWLPRTTLLSPFDNLICDRDRTERLWDFAYRNEMYAPQAKRQYGYYLMPVLAGERLTGRIAARADRRKNVLVTEGMYPEPGAPPAPALPAALGSLASFAGVGPVSYTGPVAFGVS